MKLIIFGHQRHGKDTVCEYLEAEYGLTFSASSMFACRLFLYEQIKDRFGYASLEECFEDRVNHRQLWYEAIRDYNATDRARLGKAIFAEHDVYCGIRDREEFECLKREGQFDLAIWIDASQRKPLESTASMTLTRDDADLVINNNGTLIDLMEPVDGLMDRLGIARLAQRPPKETAHALP
ncbi:MAG: hypothetical protein GX771_11335 [Halomonadaceae bacterium]|nr:hypothetical protein [Halomonadaceae bacterium]